jgi:signal transduction histidine kinase
MKTGHEDLSPHIEALSRTADELLRNAREMIWTLHPQNAPLDNTVNFIGEYFFSRMESSGVNTRIYYPDAVPDIDLPPILMRCLIRCTREATDFIVRNSTGTQADLHIDVTEENIRVRIRDNSTAVQPSNEDSSRVLTGMERKMAAVGGTCSIFSSLTGITAWFQAPFPNC